MRLALAQLQQEDNRTAVAVAEEAAAGNAAAEEGSVLGEKARHKAAAEGLHPDNRKEKVQQRALRRERRALQGRHPQEA